MRSRHSVRDSARASCPPIVHSLSKSDPSSHILSHGFRDNPETGAEYMQENVLGVLPEFVPLFNMNSGRDKMIEYRISHISCNIYRAS